MDRIRSGRLAGGDATVGAAVRREARHRHHHDQHWRTGLGTVRLRNKTQQILDTALRLHADDRWQFSTPRPAPGSAMATRRRLWQLKCANTFRAQRRAEVIAVVDDRGMGGGGSGSFGEVATLDANGSKARFGVAYVRAICSQAGVGFHETSADEDVLAVDAEVAFAIAPARLQIKCTGQFRIKGGRTATWQIDESWRRHWTVSGLPVYFVLVIVNPDEQLSWLTHHDDSTLHRAAAFWTRVDELPAGQNIVVPKQQ